MARILVRLLGVALGGVAALAGVLVVRLSQGPIDLDALSPHLAAALAAPDGAWRATIGGTQLAWDAEENDLDLVVRDVDLLARDGGAIATVPSLSVRFRIAPLLRGELRLRSIDVIAPSLTARRDLEGAWEISAGGRPRPDGPRPASFLPSPAQGGPEDIEIRHAEVTVEDAVSGLSARLGDAHLVVHWDGTRLTVEAAGGVQLGEQTVPVRLAFARDGAGPAVVEGFVDAVRLAEVGAWIGGRAQPAETASTTTAERLDQTSAALRRARLPAKAQLRADLDPTLKPVRAELTLDAGKGEVDAPAPLGVVLPLAAAKVRGRWDGDDGAVHLETLALELGGPSLVANGRRDGAGALSATVSLTGLPIAELGRYWPASAAREARAWLTENLSVGRVDQASVELTAVVPDDGPASLETLAGKVGFSNLTVRYQDAMPPATGVKGGGTFDLHAWRLRVAAGRIGDVAIAPATVTITKIEQPGTRIDVTAEVRGPLPSVLATLNHPPLLVPEHLGIDAARTSGDVKGTLAIGVPLDDDKRRTRDLDVDARATVARGALPDAVGEWPVSDAELSVAVRDDDVSVKGTLRLAGVPARVETHEVLGAPARRRLSVTSRTTARELGGLGFDASEWVDGPLDVEVMLGGTDATDLLIAIDPTRATLTLWPIGLDKAPGAPARMTATLRFHERELREIAPARLIVGASVATVQASRAGGKWGAVDARAHVVTAAGAADYVLTATPAGARHDVQVSCTDAAAVMRALGRDIQTVGGRVTFGGQIGLDVPGLPVNGHLEIERVTITRSPVLSTLLHVASLEGILDTFKRGGLVFEDASVDIVHEGKVTRLSDAFMHGQFLVITGQGTIDDGVLALRGTLVPSYFGLNRVARRIPVIGQILTGTSREGIAAVDFRIDGTAPHPKVHVSPSSLGPGIVRDLLRKLSG